MFESAARQKIGIFVNGEIDEFGDGVFHEGGFHAGLTNGTDLFFVADDGGGCAGRCAFQIENGFDGTECADAVVLSVTENHGFVQTKMACRAGRGDFDFGGRKVLFLKAVGVFHQFEDAELRLFADLLVIVFLVDGTGGDEHVEGFAGDGGAERLAGLVAAKMREEVGDGQNGIIWLLADVQLDFRAVFLEDDAMEGEREGDPLVFLDAAIVMRVEQDELVVFVERRRLEVETRAVDMGADEFEAVF